MQESTLSIDRDAVSHALTADALSTDAAEQLLRSVELRVTQPRLAVVRALHAAPHADADAVFTAVTRDLPTTSLQSVYNVLNDLDAAGLVRRIEPAGQPGRFELRVGDNHHHAVCTSCGAVADVDCTVGHAPCLTPTQTNGFAVEVAEVTYWGLCGDCQTSAIAPPKEN